MKHLLLHPSIAEEKTFDSLTHILESVNLPYTFLYGSGPHDLEDIVERHPEGVVPLGRIGMISWFREQHPELLFPYEKMTSEQIQGLLGDDAVLNQTVGVCAAYAVPWEGEEIFVKPARDHGFKGRVYNPESLEKAVGADYMRTLVAHSPVREINREVRVFILEGKIIGASQYALGGEAKYQAVHPDTLPERVKEWVAKMPGSTLAMDVAWVPESNEPFVVEFNCFNSSGLMSVDLFAYVNAIVAFLKK